MEVDTKILRPDQLEFAAYLLLKGECVAFPTETVYGLGANAMDAQAVAKIFKAKQRPADNPLIVHIYDLAQVSDLVIDYNHEADKLMEEFWPGPLSLILPRSPSVPKIVTADLDSIAIRMPDHKLALDLLKMVDLPIAAPSANISGRPSPTRAEHVFQDLKGRIPAILDGGATGWGVESTVVDCTCWPFRILRPGGITFEQLLKILPVELDPGIYQETKTQSASPGMKYRHYSPKAAVVLVVGDNISKKINQMAQKPEYSNLRLGVMAVSESRDYYRNFTVLDLGPRNDQRTIASRLYHLLRSADDMDLDVVFVEGFSEVEMGMAIMNRLRKAAGYKIVYS
ncbi:MAG: threonylcarbamoyl-AMP synthase [Firmicutes bacterium]|nr:threonylcarbamoyl-AMP synthase [Bacillota bacterium]